MAESPAIEIVRSRPAVRLRAALFDFDGTLSLLRRNWQEVMIPMMVEVLAATGTDERPETLHATVEDFVMRLNGKQTIYQMMRLAEEVAARGGTPREPLAYKHAYHDLLWREVGERVEHVRRGAMPAEEWTVPGARAFLAALAEADVALYLASGTDLHYVRDELAVLGLEEFFGPRVFGALDDYRSFSKALIVDRLVTEEGFAGAELLGVGDGFVEIQEVKRVGGLAIGVASEENTRVGVNAWKRRRLLEAGADVIVGDYRPLDDLLRLLGLRT